MRRRVRFLAAYATVALGALLLLAPAAFAHNDGQGLWGETNDKITTDAGFILIIAFPVFILLMTLLQQKLERRKDARLKAQRARAANPQWRGGW